MQAQSVLDKAGPDVIPLFVYGTLRPGGTLYDHYFDTDVVDSERACAAGYSLRTTGWFPVMAPEAEEISFGDVLWVRKGMGLMAAIRMELNAGYSLELVDVELAGMTEPMPALSFIWHGNVADMPRVTFNDWMAQ
jgi:gamma-glutamylcyclotransferase (GGCT)/AIG2-like uncharacterized protein YtfP